MFVMFWQEILREKVRELQRTSLNSSNGERGDLSVFCVSNKSIFTMIKQCSRGFVSPLIIAA